MKKSKQLLIPSIRNKNLYNIFSYFFICAFIGWIFETLVIFFETGHMTERGLLFVNHHPEHSFPFLNSIPWLLNIPLFWGLPIITLYGIGGCIIVLAFSRLKNVFAIFIIGLVVLTLLELGTSYLTEFTIHKKYWDYSTEFLNFQGRICLRSSITWGILAVFTIKFFKSKLELLWAKEKRIRNYKIVIWIVFIYTVFCTILKYFFFTK